MDLADIRRLVIIAMFSDDVLYNQIVLKGGNALNLVHSLGSRSSVDIDFSLERDFEDPEDSKNRIFAALRNRFAEVGLAVFDEGFEKKPPRDVRGREKWGGYQVEFKLTESAKLEAKIVDIEQIRREALVVGPEHQRVFRVQISKFEYCRGKTESELNDYSIYVYTPAMIAIEKLRAICQQMPEYHHRLHAVPRARDFYDIFAIITEARIRLSSLENLELIRNIFAAKYVDLSLLPLISQHREFHRQDWPSVEITVSGDLEDFDFYYDFVLDQVKLLKPLWDK